jgi:ABC-type transporter Mla subunit MlaD
MSGMEDRETLARIDANTARTAELADAIHGNTARTAELADAILVVLGEILTVLGNVQDALSDMRDLADSHSQALMQVLDRLGPGPAAGSP